MNCQNFEIIVNELARQQMMEAGVRDQALAHTDECEECSVRLEDERALTKMLGGLAREMSDDAAPVRIEGELLAAFREQKTVQPVRSTSYSRHYWVAAIAAVLLLVVGIAAMSMRSRPGSSAAELPYIPPIGPKVAVANGPPVLPGVKSPTPVLPPEGEVAKHTPKRHKNSVQTNSAAAQTDSSVPTVNSNTVVAANYSENEVATDFMPVGYTTPMNLQDGGQLMRVELPRSALAGFGLPVNMERVNERVKADVLVGPDGQARAIRFVQ